MRSVRPFGNAGCPAHLRHFEGSRDADTQYQADIQLIVWNVLYAILDQFASGQLAMTEIVPILERTLYRMISDSRRSLDRGDRPG